MQHVQHYLTALLWHHHLDSPQHTTSLECQLGLAIVEWLQGLWNEVRPTPLYISVHPTQQRVVLGSSSQLSHRRGKG